VRGILEHAFDCPYCGEPITMILDLSEDGAQDYIEDCEVCCRPIRIRVSATDGDLEAFSAETVE